MIVPPHADLHYRTRIFLRRAEAADDGEGLARHLEEIARRVREAVRGWAVVRFGPAAEELEDEAFHAGRTRLISIQPPGIVRTETLEGTVWAFGARVPDPAVRSRHWAHEVAVGPPGPDGLRVSVRVHHWLEVGEVGWRAPRPEPGAPSYLLAAARWPDVLVTDGRDPLPLDPVPVHPGDGKGLVERLADPERRVGLVYISAARADGRPAIDPARVAGAVALQGTVHVARSPDLDEELDHFLPPDLRCYGGALRIYRPGLDPRAGGARVAERHRYIPWARLASRPAEELLAEIAEEVLRDVPLEDPEREPVAFEEVEAVRRRRELAALREEARALRERSRGGLSAEDARRLFRLNERLEERVRALEEDNARLARRAFRASERLEERREAAPLAAGATPPAGTLDPAALAAALRTLPSTPAEALRLAAVLYPHRLRVTERARSAAGKAPLEDVAMAWRVLGAMAEELHPLHFDAAAERRSALEICEAFRDRTRFDVAFTESKATKASARLRALRTLRYEGEEVELRWHVKWGSRPPKLLRVYYHPDAERRMLVIDWFGDHLETAGTRRM